MLKQMRLGASRVFDMETQSYLDLSGSGCFKFFRDENGLPHLMTGKRSKALNITESTRYIVEPWVGNFALDENWKNTIPLYEGDIFDVRLYRDMVTIFISPGYPTAPGFMADPLYIPHEEHLFNSPDIRSEVSKGNADQTEWHLVGNIHTGMFDGRPIPELILDAGKQYGSIR